MATAGPRGRVILEKPAASSIETIWNTAVDNLPGTANIYDFASGLRDVNQAGDPSAAEISFNREDWRAALKRAGIADAGTPASCGTRFGGGKSSSSMDWMRENTEETAAGLVVLLEGTNKIVVRANNLNDLETDSYLKLFTASSLRIWNLFEKLTLPAS
jgi:hypothetical protein